MIVYQKSVSVSQKQLQAIIVVLNTYSLDEGEKELTLDEVMGNHDLADNICSEAIDDGWTALNDPAEYYSDDGWSDWKDFR